MASRVSQSPIGPWAGSEIRSAYWENAFGSSAAAARMGSSFSVSVAAAPSSPSMVLEVSSAPAAGRRGVGSGRRHRRQTAEQAAETREDQRDEAWVRPKVSTNSSVAAIFAPRWI
jgi:hypothetical protein